MGEAKKPQPAPGNELWRVTEIVVPEYHIAEVEPFFGGEKRRVVYDMDKEVKVGELYKLTADLDELYMYPS